MLHKCYVLNTPMFFENIWESQLSTCIDADTLNKIFISSTDTHDDLLEEVDEYELPELYGGVCSCKAQCIYSEKGPWTEVENFINYQDPTANQSDSSDGDVDERNIGNLQ